MTDCCLPDIRIAQLPRVTTIELDDLLVIDQLKGPAGDNAIFETRAITWGHALGIYPPDGGGGGDPDLIIPNPDHNIILNGTVKFLDGTELRPSITFIFDDNTGFYRPGENTIGFTTGGSRVMVLREDYMGVGTDYPIEKIHVEQGNILIMMGDDGNGLFMGSSHRGIGGDPSIQSTGLYDLTFHVGGTMFYKFTITGALGVKAGNSMDVGQNDFLLTSTGAGGPPRWQDPADIFDLKDIIADIDNNYIGKGELHIYPQTTIVGSTGMPSGLDYVAVPATDGIHPNANSFYEAGWNLNVDETVVRTGGDQVISGIKTWQANTYGANAHIHMEDRTEFQLMSGSKMFNLTGSAQYVQKDAFIQLQNKSDFLFDKLDYPPNITP
jgi:hypothetical protein